MICNICGKHPATVYFKGMVNNQTLKMHICDTCANKKGVLFPLGKTGFSLGDLVANLSSAMTNRPNPSLLGVFCKKCRMTYAEFKLSGQLGCSNCYVAFASVLGPMLGQIHNSTQHIGKTYKKTVRPTPPVQELARLRMELRESIQHEAFEQAAMLRDQIQQLEHQIKQP